LFGNQKGWCLHVQNHLVVCSRPDSTGSNRRHVPRLI
jgi:hypothetical protein